jgi:hypothetical protein
VAGFIHAVGERLSRHAALLEEVLSMMEDLFGLSADRRTWLLSKTVLVTKEQQLGGVE